MEHGGCTNPTMFQVVVISKINAIVARWANEHMDEYTAPLAPISGGGRGGEYGSD